MKSHLWPVPGKASKLISDPVDLGRNAKSPASSIGVVESTIGLWRARKEVMP
jgi:hypothetical protein